MNGKPFKFNVQLKGFTNVVDLLITVVRWFTFVGLALLAFGTGGIKPCVAAFGADQFTDNQVFPVVLLSSASSTLL